MNNYVINALTNILNIYQSMRAYFYQHITQNQFTNNDLATYVINYELLLPSSQYIYNLTYSQVTTQIQSYIETCNLLITYITSNTNIQINLTYEQIQNILNISIANLNGFAISLLEAGYQSLIIYTVPYSMSMTNVLFLNNINLDTYPQQIRLNYSLSDFNNIPQNTNVTLVRS